MGRLFQSLFVGPFPLSITRKEKQELLLYFGAAEVIHVAKKEKEIYAIARFSTHRECEYALLKLHQIEILGVRISAKYYDPSKESGLSISKSYGTTSKDSVENKASNHTSKMNAALLRYEAQLTAINSILGVKFPLSPKLRYCYPSPTPTILCNIAHALVAAPKFYTQVLHLMNKMNLPCPFGKLTGEPLLCKEAKKLSSVFSATEEENLTDQNISEPVPQKETLESETLHSETESEIESDEELKSFYSKQKKVIKRPSKPKSTINKRPKLETIKQSLLGSKEHVNKPPRETISSELKEIFEMPNLNQVKKLQVNVQPTAVLGIESPAEIRPITTDQGFGKLFPQPKVEETGEKPSSQFISDEELLRNRIPESDWPIVPVFKNYDPGTQSDRLYIKNLAKNVTEYDLRCIFGRYQPMNIEEEASKFTIRLMKEGRMKGQAFITYSSSDAAVKALRAANGYILKDKPMVVMFGKAKTKD